MQIIGDAYVKDEFKRHKAADQMQTKAFMEAWAKYALTISKQVDTKRTAKSGGIIGEALKAEDLDQFNNEQLAQLFELYEETGRPQDEYPKWFRINL